MPLVEAQVVWSPVASNQNFDVGMDYSSVKRSMEIAKGRIRTTDKSDRSIMYEDLEVDCQVKKVRSVWAKKYDWRNKVIGISTSQGSWDSVQPNTIMSLIYAEACR